MKRRTFLASLGAFGLSPALKLPSMAMAAAPVSAAPAAAFSAANYNWAALIVRAHNNSSISFLQRHLNIDAAEAVAIESELVKKGILQAGKDAFGLRKAVDPILQTFNPSPKTLTDVAKEKISDFVDEQSEKPVGEPEQTKQQEDDALKAEDQLQNDQADEVSDAQALASELTPSPADVDDLALKNIA